MFNHSRAHTNTHAKHTFFRCFVCDLIKLNALIGSKYISCDASHVRQRRRRRRRHTVHIRGSQIFCCPFKFVSFEYNVGNGNECELKGTWKWKKDSAKRDTSETEWEMAEERRRTVSWTFPMLIQWHVCHVCICFSFFHFVRTAIMCVCVCVYRTLVVGRRSTSDSTATLHVDLHWMCIFRVQTKVFTIQFTKWILIEWCTYARQRRWAQFEKKKNASEQKTK